MKTKKLLIVILGGIISLLGLFFLLLGVGFISWESEKDFKIIQTNETNGSIINKTIECVELPNNKIGCKFSGVVKIKGGEITSLKKTIS